ncbi:E3 binding domain-containing protein [Aliamphritea spongicola]
MTPAVRALAQRLGVDINQLQGSGHDGHITPRTLSMRPTLISYTVKLNRFVAYVNKWPKTWPVRRLKWCPLP